MRTLALFLGLASLATAQSHPSWWTFAPPEAKTLVGIEWQNLRTSPLGEAVESELSSGGSLGIPDLPCIKNSRDFLIAAPPFITAASGGCVSANLRSEAPAIGMSKGAYRGVEIWTAPTGTAVAQFAEHVVLIGSRKIVEGAIDRSQAETKTYSPLLATGAKLAHGHDLWVVAATLPEPIASIFVPLDVTAHNFEGGLSVKDGLEVSATFDAGSESAARATAGTLRTTIVQGPGILKALKIVNEAATVTLNMTVGAAEFQASLKNPTTNPPPAATVVAAVPEAIPHIAAPEPIEHIQGHFNIPAPAPVAAPESKAEVKAATPERRVVRIYGLDEGTREIVLPPKPPDQE